MKRFTVDAADPEAIVGELLHWDGAVLLSGLFRPDEVAEARAIIMAHTDAEGGVSLHRRLGNLLAKGDVFSRMAAHPTIIAILRRFLGSEFILGSIAADRVLPGGPGQEPHVDYPYCDHNTPEAQPVGLNATFPMNAQLCILLDPFTKETGATAFVPGSQRKLRSSENGDQFLQNCEWMLGEPGDVLLYFGAVLHCAMANVSQQDRSAILVQYLPKWVKPMEDMPAALPSSFIDGASDDMRQLLGLECALPDMLDAAPAVHAGGRI